MVEGDAGDGRSSTKRGGLLALGRLRFGAAIALLVALLVALMIDVGSGAGGGPGWNGVVGEFELRQRSYTFAHSAYWLGPRPPTDRYQIETPTPEDIYIRYVEDPDEPGPGLSHLTVATYAVPDASAALARAGRESGERVSRHPGFEMLAAPEANSAYLVLEGVPELQIEIYSPRDGEAAKLAESGTLARLR